MPELSSCRFKDFTFSKKRKKEIFFALRYSFVGHMYRSWTQLTISSAVNQKCFRYCNLYSVSLSTLKPLQNIVGLERKRNFVTALRTFKETM